MIPELVERRADLEVLCRRFAVRRLEVFGSAVSDSFRYQESDLDFFVEFQEQTDAGYADRYFGLLESLEQLFGRSVDLIVDASITNLYFRQSVMRLEAKKYPYDIQQAVRLPMAFTAGKTFDDYARDAILRSALERQFEITGEALAQLASADEQVAARVTEYHRIIAFRNILIHGYAQVDDRLVWDVIESKLLSSVVTCTRCWQSERVLATLVDTDDETLATSWAAGVALRPYGTPQLVVSNSGGTDDLNQFSTVGCWQAT